MSRLVMFTDSYPYNRLDEWKLFELEAFARHFDEVHVAPRVARHPDPDPRLPANVRALPPAFPSLAAAATGGSRLGAIARLALQPRAALPGLRPSRWRPLVSAERERDAILASPAFRDHVAPLLGGSRLYFFWGRGYADILPLLPRAQQAASLVRLHRYDLYPEASGGYIPFQAGVVRAAGALAPVSDDGERDLARRFPAQAAKIACLRLGTLPQPPGPWSEDGTLRLVSCAAARSVKRLHLIAAALAHADLAVRWTHIGDGPELPRLRALAERLPPHAAAEFTGAIAPPEVPRHYQAHPYDLFLNVSDSEGVPVSIMEAMAAGIPALATDVGGTRELVTAGTGRLVPADIAPAALWQAIAAFARQDRAATAAMRAASVAAIRDRYDIRTNAERVAQALLALPAAA